MSGPSCNCIPGRNVDTGQIPEMIMTSLPCRHMPLRFFCILLGLTMTFSTGFSDDLVSLTDTRGRSLDARILSFVGGKVKVQMPNTMQYDIPLTKLDEASRKRVYAWVVQQIREHREPFKFSIQNFKENKIDRKTASSRIKTFDEGYEVKVENQMTMPVSGLTAEYMILKEGAVVAAQSRSMVQEETLKGQVKLGDMGIRGTSTFRTKTLPITENRLRGGWGYVDGGSDNAVDQLGGIWIQIKSGNEVVFEYSRPDRLKEDLKWEPSQRK